MKQKHHTDGLIFKFALIFGIFLLITLVLSGFATYANQTQSYKAQCVQNIRNIGDYLEHLVQESGEEFVTYQDFYMKHFAEADIPFDFSEYNTAQARYERALSDFAGGAELSPENFGFDSESEEVRMAYFIYMHERWILTFEDARKTFNLPYTYYLVPKEEIYHMVYMIDGERSHRGEDGKMAESGEFLYLGDEYFDAYDDYRVQWDTWFTGERQDGFQVWNNAWGHTYAYYTPVIINGKKLGLIGTEIAVASVNQEILRNTLSQMLEIGLVLIVCISILLFFINRAYISKIVSLEADMREYALDKNESISKRIRNRIRGKDEISSLSRQFAQMILELAEYMRNLMSTTKELIDTKEHAEKMHSLANKDALTGIRNKTAYDSEVRRLEWGLADGKTDFGIAMIDLNFLKRINDTFGHEKGDVAIKTLCYIVCHVFEHSPVFRIGGDWVRAVRPGG